MMTSLTHCAFVNMYFDNYFGVLKCSKTHLQQTSATLRRHLTQEVAHAGFRLMP